ncbi:MAG: carboxypeptidase-like regulatory domain-containing protein, partial [Gemmatimonadaceae bacterium]
MLPSVFRDVAGRMRSPWTAVLLAVAVQLTPTAAVAQATGTLAGTVVNERSGAPISDAQIAVEGRHSPTPTDAPGRFRFARLTGTGEVQLTVRRIGFVPKTVAATIGAASV